VLQATADYRIRTVTQVLENIAFRADIESDTVVLADFARLLAIPWRCLPVKRLEDRSLRQLLRVYTIPT